MNLPRPVAHDVEAAIRRATGRPDPIDRVEPIGGGCINPAARIATEEGRDFFVKWNDGAADVFAAEAVGLRALAAPAALRVPEVVDLGGGGSDAGPAWLLLEYVRTGRPAPGYARRLGRGLAELHRRGADAAAEAGVEGSGSGWGWGRDNWIGSLPQANRPAPTWVEFWRDLRIVPQLEGARERGFLVGDRELDDLVHRMGPALEAAEEDGPSLVHGDLWGGNVMTDRHGKPVLIDPAAYRGHREVDLAMSELFGGFPSGFLGAYEESWPLLDGYRRVRRALYQLYYLLVHVNLFGRSYVGRTLTTARSALSAL